MTTTAGAHAQGFFEIAARDRDAIALRLGTDSITRGELLDDAHRWSRVFQHDLGLERGDTVALVLPNGPTFIAAQLAAEQVGLYLVLVNWHLTASEAAYLIGDSGARAVVTEASLEPVVIEAARLGSDLAPDRVVVVGGAADGRSAEAMLARHPATEPTSRSAGSVQYYSSGTSGRPKGVRRPLPTSTPDEAADARARQRFAQYDMNAEVAQVHLVVAPLYHPAPNLNALCALHLGQELVITARFDATETLALIDQFRVTSTFMVPVMFHRLLDLDEATRGAFSGRSLQMVTHAGAPCPPEVKRRMIEWWGPIISEYYGCTEFGIATIITSEEALLKPGSAGRAAPGIQVEIRGSDGLRLPTGEPGTIYVSGGFDFTYSGAAGDLCVNGASSANDPFRTAGDVGHLDEDGYLYVGDRRSDLILSGGVNIYPAEVEAALATEPSVADVVVIGLPDQEWGQRVVAVIELKPDAVADEGAATRLREHLADRLARFKTPREFHFVESVGRTSTGKINRSQISALMTDSSRSSSKQ
ncbi:AMP-binding protein [Saccharopolyspora sp. ASAGF58]|uniref:AMP-binding protein n=1 Tax=Saccharopolyspora sp. ASAGF58 TaxID=2719023 RepID=UPI00143FDE5D|nr:AMP-binding protein [Saccharopolyspora sp. ASAGF58]QIZ37065.1 acyl-CoA synthetase [Saccharopolyspora sp. ASAGF58]